MAIFSSPNPNYESHQIEINYNWMIPMNKLSSSLKIKKNRIKINPNHNAG